MIARHGRLAAALVGLALLAAPLGACSKRDATPSDESAPVVDTSLLAYLSLARALHREADIAENEDDPKKAVAAMDRLFATQVPGPSPEIDEVLSDSHARMGELLAGLGEFDRAESHVQKGLELAKKPTFFRGRLLEVRGLVEEKRAKALREKGDKEGARAADKRAVEASEEAIKILQSVIKEKAPRPGSSK